MKILHYLSELKWYFFYNFYLLSILLILNFIYFNDILYLLLKPLFSIEASNLSQNYLIFTNLTDILLIYIKIYLITSVYLYIPIFFWQIQKFITTGLYFYEKLLFKYINISLISFFIINNLLIYFFFIPIIWKFFLNFEILSNIELFNLYFEGKINDYLSLIFRLLININLCLSLPFILILLNYNNIISLSFIKNQRKYIYFILLIFCTLISPPDILSLSLLLLLLYFFYEITLFSLFIIKNYT